MTPENWRALGVLFGSVLAAAAVVVGYTLAMYARHGAGATVSSAMTALLRHHPLAVVAFVFAVGLALGGLAVHWWEN